ncbi:hypothetical protein [Parafrankia sp. FMc2]|uniref:hypothetical protein n=1 Tax=Parafrankia sp. FMc2 TaxID=3233196 RepID=UPI0034D4F3FA
MRGGGAEVLEPAQTSGDFGGGQTQVQREDSCAHRPVGPGEGVADGEDVAVGAGQLVPVPALRLARDVPG